MSRRAGAEENSELRAKYLELVRKYSTVVHRASVRMPVLVAGVSTPARIASIAVALLDGSGKIVECSARWKLIAPRSLGQKLREALAKGRRSPSIQQLRVPGRSGATLVLRLEAIDKGLAIALASEEAVTWAVDDERTQSRLWHGERLRVLGELAASVAHDLSSTLRSVRYLLSSVEADEVVRKRCGAALSSMARGIDDSSNVIRRLHDFARNGSQGLQTVQVKGVIDEAVKLLELEGLEDGTTPHVRVTMGALPSVRASPGELVHVVLNLLRNAREATSDRRGRISVICAQAREVVRIAVSDDGMGIPSTVFPRLFEPFFTTKGGKGTGLGLFICASLVERMGGTIYAANRPNGGALFTVELPAISAGAPSAEPLREARELGSPAAPKSRRVPRARKRSSAD
ncbi:MAG TPA: ATP-binding protein [Myxococcales bacterium]|jgi:C4-dicarboxylate-specific signal transduction histidine kinase